MLGSAVADIQFVNVGDNSFPFNAAGVLEQAFDWRAGERGWPERRRELAQELAASGELHLVLVRYETRHTLTEEWISNEADIDAAPVVLARSVSADADRRLLEHFAGRRIWRLETGARPLELVRFEPEPTEQATSPGTDRETPASR